MAEQQLATARVVKGAPPAQSASLSSGSRALNGDQIFRVITIIFAVVILVLAGAVVVTLLLGSRETLSRYGLSFLTGTTWDPTLKKEFGALPFIFGTLVTSVVALLLAGIVGVGVALLLVELRLPSQIASPVSFLIEMLAAIPSVVYGAWGFIILIPYVQAHIAPWLQTHLGWLPFFGPATAGGASLLTAALILAVMIVPTVSSISRDVIRVVPNEQREGMLALGATRWEMIWRAVLPYARAGIVGALILALGRAVGETIAATMVIGNQVYIGPNLLAGGDTLASRVANNFGEATDSLYRSALIELGLILLVISLILNVLARLFVWSISRNTARVV
jgi:phosphate transport system permease protein